jgi:hypothetical protein
MDKPTNVNHTPGIKARLWRIIGKLFRRRDWYERGLYSYEDAIDMCNDAWESLRKSIGKDIASGLKKQRKM